MNCSFDTTGGYYDIYCYYSGYGKFIIENNMFDSDLLGKSIYLLNYQSGVPVDVIGNTFSTGVSLEDVAYLTDHSSYVVSFNASNNTFAKS